jgi:hypothetical protein
MILYGARLPGAHAEFAAYRILYHTAYAKSGEAKSVMGSMQAALGNEFGQVAGSQEVVHALKVGGSGVGRGARGRG